MRRGLQALTHSCSPKSINPKGSGEGNPICPPQVLHTIKPVDFCCKLQLLKPALPSVSKDKTLGHVSCNVQAKPVTPLHKWLNSTYECSERSQCINARVCVTQLVAYLFVTASSCLRLRGDVEVNPGNKAFLIGH